MKIDDKTPIPIGIAIVVIGGASVWMTTTQDRLATNTVDIHELREDRAGEVEMLRQVQLDVATIKIKVQELANASKKKRYDSAQRHDHGIKTAEVLNEGTENKGTL